MPLAVYRCPNFFTSFPFFTETRGARTFSEWNRDFPLFLHNSARYMRKEHRKNNQSIKERVSELCPPKILRRMFKERQDSQVCASALSKLGT